jgi:cystathionine beta-lyase/cystathionine gamma-synthase
MATSKSNFLNSERNNHQDRVLTPSVKELGSLLSETSYIINGLQESLEAQKIKGVGGELLATLSSCKTLAELKEISFSINKLRLDLRAVCKKSSSKICTNWQSPPMESALDASIKENAGEMVSNGVDYHRALHLAGINYERNFLESILSNSQDCTVLATSSGMAAINTALQYISQKISSTQGPVIVDQGCYHETRFIAEALFAHRLKYLDLSSSQSLEILDEIKPALVIFDSTRNSKSISLLPVAEILGSLKNSDCFVLVDTTSLVSPEPIISEAKSKKIFDRTIIVTSLAKLHQYGLDLVTAGAIIYHRSLDNCFPGVKNFRTHVGANISEDSAVILPRPSLGLLQRRAELISRNVDIISSALIQSKIDILVETAQCWGSPGTFAPYFNISKTCSSESHWYRPFINRVMHEARNRRIPVLAGASFGFDVSRIYFVESLIPTHKPFIRIAPGVESLGEVELLAEVIVEAAKDK